MEIATATAAAIWQRCRASNEAPKGRTTQHFESAHNNACKKLAAENTHCKILLNASICCRHSPLNLGGSLSA